MQLWLCSLGKGLTSIGHYVGQEEEEEEEEEACVKLLYISNSLNKTKRWALSVTQHENKGGKISHLLLPLYKQTDRRFSSDRK